MGKVVDLEVLARAFASLDLTQLGDALAGFKVGVDAVDELDAVDMEWLAADIRARIADDMKGRGSVWLFERAAGAWPLPTEGGAPQVWMACGDGIGVATETGVDVYTWEEVLQ